MDLMQGDQLGLAIKIKDKNSGSVLTDSELENVEIAVGYLIKDMSDGVYYSNEKWIFPITQEESFKMSGKIPVQVRIKPRGGGFIKGKSCGYLDMDVSTSRRKL